MFPVGNNLNRGHIYFQDSWKRFSILFKAQQLQFNRKQKQKSKKREREESPPGPYLCWPSHLARPSLLALPVVVLLRPEGREAHTRRASATRRPPPASADAGRHPEDATRPPGLPLILAHSPPRLPLSLSRDGRARTSLPIVVAATIATPSPLRRAH